MFVGLTRGRLGAASFAAAACVAAVAAGSANAKPLTTVRITYDPNPSNTTVVVAKAEGFFKQNGINAVLSTSLNTAGVMGDLGKTIDIDNSTIPSLLQADARGENLTMIGDEDVETNTLKDTYLIANKSITSISQLKGAKIGVASFSGTLYEAVVVALQKAGISKNQVDFVEVPIPDMPSDLASGTIQAADTIVPFQGELLGEGYTNLGDPVLSVSHGQEASDIGWGAKLSWALTHESAVKGFIKANEEAVTWIKSHKAATEAILEKDFQLPAVAADNYPLYQYFQFKVEPAYITDWVKPMQEDGDLSKSYKPDLKELIFPS